MAKAAGDRKRSTSPASATSRAAVRTPTPGTARRGIIPKGGTSAAYGYGYDIHSNVSFLLDESGAASASYGYGPYGAADPELTAGNFDPAQPTDPTAPDRTDDPLNPFRYTAKRFDSGSGSLDMAGLRCFRREHPRACSLAIKVQLLLPGSGTYTLTARVDGQEETRRITPIHLRPLQPQIVTG